MEGPFHRLEHGRADVGHEVEPEGEDAEDEPEVEAEDLEDEGGEGAGKKGDEDLRHGRCG